MIDVDQDTSSTRIRQMYKTNAALDPVKTLNLSADLVTLLGDTELENGTTLKQALTIDGFSFWDAISPELAHSYIPKILASAKPPSIQNEVRCFLLSKNIFRRKLDFLKIKTGITSHLKIDVPTFSEKQLPSSLKLIPITTPGSRFIK